MRSHNSNSTSSRDALARGKPSFPKSQKRQATANFLVQLGAGTLQSSARKRIILDTPIARAAKDGSEDRRSTGWKGTMDTLLVVLIVCAAVALFTAVRVWLVFSTFDDMITHKHTH